MPILIAALVLIGFYVFFIVGPSAVAARLIFARMPAVTLDDLVGQDTRYSPFMDKMIAGRDYFESKEPRELFVRTKDGLSLRGRYLDLGASRTVIFFHGYHSDTMINFSYHVPVFASHGYNVLIVEQRAHGKSGGNTLTLGIKESDDALLWADLAASMNGVRAVVPYGLSMGACSVAMAADRFDPAKVRAMVLDCGYTSVRKQLVVECRRRRLPYPLMTPLIRLFARIAYGIDVNEPVGDRLARTRVPAFFIHGDGDLTVPIRETEQNFAACASEKELYVSPGAQHTVGFPSGGDEAEEKLFAFLDKYTNNTSLEESYEKI